VEAGLHKHGGNMAAVARAHGVRRQSVWEYVQARPALLAAVRDCREGLKDDAEAALLKAVKRGEAWAVCFFLKCQAKDRGYIERQEVKDVSDEEIDRALDEAIGGVHRNGQAKGPGPAPRAAGA
jgi:hypothetical protein